MTKLAKNKVRKTVAYLRYSSHNQKETSIQDQLRACKSKAKEMGVVIDEVYSDSALTGTNTNRPKYNEMMESVKRGELENIIVYKLDRLHRNMNNATELFMLADLNNTGIISAMESIDNSAAGKLARNMHLIVAQHYVDNLSELAKRGQESNVLRGEYNGGGITYGYKVNKETNTFEIEDTEAKVVKEVFQMCKNGDSYTDITKKLEAQGVVNRNGNYFVNTSISKMLKNEMYTGTYVYGKTKEVKFYNQVKVKKRDSSEVTRVEGVIPQIITSADFEYIQEKLQKNANNSTKAKSQYLLQGVIKCGECGSNFVGNSKGVKDIKKGYCCSGKKQKNECTCKSIDRTKLEDLVLNLVIDKFTNTKEGKLLVDNVIDGLLKEKRSERKLELQRLRRLKKKLEKEVDKDVQRIGELNNEMENIKNNKIDSKKFKQAALDSIYNELKGYMLEEVNSQEKVNFMQAMVAKVEVFKTNVKIELMDLDSDNETVHTINRKFL